jgi:hypothetical protein
MTELMRRRLGVTPSGVRRGESARAPVHPFEE